MRYAQGTEVAVSKSRAEIESVVTRYGATSFASATTGNKAQIMFEYKTWRVLFSLPLPDRAGYSTKTRYGRVIKVDAVEQEKMWEAACRQRWRALLLVIKAKLEAVESDITNFETEFMPYIVLPGGKTAGEWLTPQLKLAYENKKMPPMLLGGS